ncbi:unnamed protein product [Schistocephalus solidus]|uniref:Polycystin family receptor for egg jelly n=1 Tax=Schistocephalus solidus TaxID=70667 RepID=A0A183T282_SCHSO|nr:unnamed protein product [Schistocephalus solidus]
MALLSTSSTEVKYFGTFNLPGKLTVTAALRELTDGGVGAEQIRTATISVLEKLERVHITQQEFTANVESQISLSPHTGYQLTYNWRVCEDSCTNISTGIPRLAYTFSRSGKASIEVTVLDNFESRQTFQRLRIFDCCRGDFPKPSPVYPRENITYVLTGEFGADCWFAWSIDGKIIQRMARTPSLEWVFERSGTYRVCADVRNPIHNYSQLCQTQSVLPKVLDMQLPNASCVRKECLLVFTYKDGNISQAKITVNTGELSAVIHEEQILVDIPDQHVHQNNTYTLHYQENQQWRSIQGEFTGDELVSSLCLVQSDPIICQREKELIIQIIGGSNGYVIVQPEGSSPRNKSFNPATVMRGFIEINVSFPVAGHQAVCMTYVVANRSTTVCESIYVDWDPNRYELQPSSGFVALGSPYSLSVWAKDNCFLPGLDVKVEWGDGTAPLVLHDYNSSQFLVHTYSRPIPQANISVQVNKEKAKAGSAWALVTVLPPVESVSCYFNQSTAATNASTPLVYTLNASGEVNIMLLENGTVVFIEKASINERISYVRLKGHFANISIVSVYAPPSAVEMRDKETFYSPLPTSVERLPRRELLIVAGNVLVTGA